MVLLNCVTELVEGNSSQVGQAKSDLIHFLNHEVVGEAEGEN